MSTLLQHGPVLIFIAAMLWALDGVIRRSLFVLPPIKIVFFEHLIGTAILLPWLIAGLKKEKSTAQSLGWVVVVSLLSGLLGTLWFTTALLRVNFIAFSVVFLLQKLQPIFATTSAALLLKEKITPTYLKWAGLAMIAAYFVTFKNGMINLETGAGTVSAAAFAVGAAFAWGTSTTFSKLLLKTYSHATATGLRFACTTIFALIALFWMQGSADAFTITGSQFTRFLFIALSTGMVGLLIYYKGLQKTEAKVSTIVELTFPLLAVMIDAVLYKTLLAPTQYLAAVVLFYAVYKTAQLNQAEKTIKQS